MRLATVTRSLSLQVLPSNGSVTGGTVITIEGADFTWSDDSGQSVDVTVTINRTTCSIRSIDTDR